MTHGASGAVFIAQLVTLLLVGRLVGEALQRLGQPAVIGQIIAGVLLGPSCLGALAPRLWQALFPVVAQQQAMLDAVSQLGILLLLLITGMETDLSVLRHARRAAVSVSLSGVIVPFLCGIALGALLPDSMLPDAQRPLITILFLGTALSISSVKIVALVVRDLGFLRRTVGQVILAAAILDDTIGWIVISVTFGLALHGAIDLGAVAHSVLGAALFLVLSLTFGRRLVFSVLRWLNDTLTSEMANITTILVITGLLALLTNVLGVHFVLGAFIAGLLLGQSPMLTRQLSAQLRGLIMGLFMPVFFTLVGFTLDVSALAQARFLWLTLVLIALASVGKFLGAFIGGRFGGLTRAESFAVGCGMNARGSTEVIVASLGLQLGALNLHLFTAIVAMAVVTTMVMPPMLRWAFGRLPLTEQERVRIEREDFEARGFLAGVERLLVAVDSSPSGRFASQLAGLLAASRRTPTTIAIAIERGQPQRRAAGPLHVLVTVSGTSVSRRGAEVAIVLAQASRGSVTALHVGALHSRAPRWGLRFGEPLVPRAHAAAVIREIVAMGEHYGVEVRGEIRSSGTVRNAVLRELARRPHDLLVMGVNPRPGDQLFLGELAAEMLARAQSSLLFVCADPRPRAAPAG